MRKLLFTLLALIAGLVAADRVAVAVAERKIGDRVASAYGLPARPGVRIAGFPFLTQVLAGAYHTVNIDVATVLAGGVRVTGLDTRFTGVHASLAQVLGRSAGPVTAQQASATGTVPLSALRSGLPRGVTLHQDGGQLDVAGTAHYLGRAVPYSATVQPQASSAGITLTPRQIRVGRAGHVPARTIATRLRFTIPLGALPLHLQISSVRVGPAGLHISATGRDIHFATNG
jgi:LmeA-like phospholipid-binding